MATFRVKSDRAEHSISSSAVEEKCRACGEPASHKIEEVSIGWHFHPLTAYLCCQHFGAVVGDCGTYPYEPEQAGFPAQRTTGESP